MKWLQRLFDLFRGPFEGNGKLKAFHPLFEASENFFFGPAARTGAGPHVRDPLDVKRFMTMVILGLAPATMASFYFFGWRMLAMILVSYTAGGIVEVVFAVLRKEEINEGFLVTGLIFPLILPPALPLWMVAVGVAFGVVVGKELFGGTGRNVFNPALVGRCFLALGYPAAMAANWIAPGTGILGRLTQYVDASTVDAVSSATPLVAAKGGEFASTWSLFLGNVSGSAGETSALAIILGGVFLLATRVANWRTVVGMLGSFLALGIVLRLAAPDSFGPTGWHMCAGGLLFGAFFMATDPVSSPVTNTGKWVYGILIGSLTLLIRNLTGYVEGVMFAILIANIVAPLVDEIVFRSRFRRMADEG